MKNKVGASHLGFILSFVIFITFLFFVYSTLEPTLKIRASKQPVLDLLRFSLMDNFKVEDFTTMTIDITFTLDIAKECMKITGGEIHDIYSSGQELTIKDGEDNLLSYGDSSGNLVISPLPANNLLKIYYATGLGKGSPNYAESGCGSNNIGQSEYDVGQIVGGQKKIFLSGITTLKDAYDLDCGETLKSNLGVPEGNDFTFSFESAVGNKIEPKPECGSIPNTDVYATIFPLEYLDENADSKIGFMTIKAW